MMAYNDRRVSEVRAIARVQLGKEAGVFHSVRKLAVNSVVAVVFLIIARHLFSPNWWGYLLFVLSVHCSF